MRPTTQRAFARLRVETRLSERDRRNSDCRLRLATGLVEVIIAGRAEFLCNRAMNGAIIELPFFGQQAAENNSIRRHGGRFVMRDLFTVKTQYDDGDLSSVSPITMPFERRRIPCPVKVRSVK